MEHLKWPRTWRRQLARWLVRNEKKSRPVGSPTVNEAGSGGGMMYDPNSRNVSAALQSAAVWACCRLISESIASLPSHIFEDTPQGKVKAYGHPYYGLLTRSPNPQMTWPQFVQAEVLHLLLYGNGYVWMDRLEGEVIALWPLRPDRVVIARQIDGTYAFRYCDPRGEVHYFSGDDLMHFRLFSLDGVIGLAPLDYHRVSFDFEQQAQGYASAIYQNGGRPSGVLKYPGLLKKEAKDKISESWRLIHGGAANSGRVAILDNGVEYSAISVPLQQLEYIQTMKFSVEQIARIYGVAPHLIGAMDKPTYASVEQQSLEFLRYTINPVVVGIERSIETALLEQPYIFRFNLNGFERTDLKSRYQAYAVGRQWGWLSSNDIRELEEMNKIVGGDAYLSPLNMATAATDPIEVGTGAVQE